MTARNTLGLVLSLLLAAACTSPMYFRAKGNGGEAGNGGSGGTGGDPTFCEPGQTRECYTGPEGTKGQGICKAGKETCGIDGSGFGPCEGETLPQSEECAAAKDENCDGLAPPCQGLCLWSVVFGDAAEQSGSHVARDAAGDVFVVGTFSGTADFGGGPKVSAEGGDVFVAKLTASGSHLWSRTFGGKGVRTPKTIAVDAAGDVIVVGQLTGTTDFGYGPVSSGGAAFVAKLDSMTGASIWARIFGDASFKDIGGAPDEAGNVLIAGGFLGTVDFGGGPITSNAGAADAFVVKLDGAGAHIWSKRFGNDGYQTVSGVATDASGNVLIVGGLTGTVDFGGGLLAGEGEPDVFVAKLDGAGAHVWSRRFGDMTAHPAADITIDSDGNVLVAGGFAGTLDFGGGPLTSGGGLDLFVAKLDGAGAHIWSKRFGQVGEVAPRIKSDAAGNVLVAGGFVGTVDFGGGPLASAGASADIFVAKLDGAGAHVWSKRFGDANAQAANGLSVDSSGVVLAGRVVGTVDFGCGPLSNGGATDAFVAKLAP